MKKQRLFLIFTLLASLVLFSNCKDENKAPVIMDIYSTPAIDSSTQVYSGDSLELSVDAMDEEMNVMNYIWSAGDGRFKGSANEVSATWVAPDVDSKTSVSITVSVSDGLNSVEDNVSLAVLPKPDTTNNEEEEEVAETGSVSGTLYYEGTQIPIEGANISIAGQYFTTSEDGSFRFEELEEGTHTITIQKHGMDTLSYYVQIASEATLNVEMEPADNGSSLRGQVTSQNGLNEMADVKVVLMNPDSTQSNIYTYTDYDGDYNLRGVPKGNQHIRFIPPEMEEPQFDDVSKVIVSLNSASANVYINSHDPEYDQEISADKAIEMVYIEGGESRKRVSYRDYEYIYMNHNYSISKYEITNQEYCWFLNNKNSIDENGNDKDFSYIDIDTDTCQIEYTDGQFVPKKGKENFPVVEVSWYGAKAFCEWIGGDLPTELEWEYAAIGGQESNGYINSGSDTFSEVGWWSENSGGRSHIVGKKFGNELQIFDMSGNVWEWLSNKEVKGGGFNALYWGGRVYQNYERNVEIGHPDGGIRLVIR